MATRFVATAENIEKINKLYYEIGVKAEVARQLGCSAATVSKYIINGWLPPSELPDVDFEAKEADGPSELIRIMSCHPVSAAAGFCEYCKLSDDEWIAMQQLQEEYVTA